MGLILAANLERIKLMDNKPKRSWEMNKKKAEAFSKGFERRAPKKEDEEQEEPLSNAYKSLKGLFRAQKEPQIKNPS
jgi:hypothetical protein